MTSPWSNVASFVFAAVAVVFVCDNLRGQTSITVNANQRRSIGGVSTLERDRFFNYTETLTPGDAALSPLIFLEDALNISPGRVSTELDAIVVPYGPPELPEDPNRPGQGFIDPDPLRDSIRGSFRNFVLNDVRYAALRAKSATSVLVNSGRSFDRWPEYFRTSGGTTSNYFPKKEAYAEFISIFLEEAVNGPNAFMPVASDRYHVELLNEPDLHFGDTSPQELIDYHKDVAQLVKAQHPTASIGGPSLAITDFSGSVTGSLNEYGRFNQFLKPLIEQAGDDLDFYSIHPYERYDVGANGMLIGRRVLQSPGRTNVSIDLIQAQQLKSHQNTLPIAVTEYGSFQRYEGTPTDQFYTRVEQQWDLSKDVREKLFVFLNRPDAVLNATPFIQGKDFVNTGGATRVVADNVLFEQDANGDWSETILAEMFRTYAPLKGEFIRIDADNKNLQSVAFRDGDQVYLMLNNLLDSNQQLDLNLLLGQFGSVTSATVDRIFQTGSGSSFATGFEQGIDVTSSYENYTLTAEEGAVITFSLDGTIGLTIDTRENTYYSDSVVTALSGTGESPIVGIDAEVIDAIAASLRIGFTTDSNTPEGFEVFINGDSIGFVNGDTLGIDDGDTGHFAREIDVPVELLTSGNTDVQIDFAGSGGFLSTAALIVTSNISSTTLGDVNLDGVVNFLDISSFISVLIAGEYQAEADIDLSGTVDFLDISPFIGILSSQ